MLDGFLFDLLLCEVLEHPQCFSLHLTEHIVQHFVSKEFLNQINVSHPYNSVSWNVESVQVVQLGLALVELVQICILESNPGMTLVDL